MNKFELEEKLTRCFEKANISAYNITFDEDELASFYVDQSGTLFFEGVKTNYSVADINRVMYYFEDDDLGDNNYVKIFFSNGDYLLLYPYATYTALINGIIYRNKDILRAFKENAPDDPTHGFKTGKEVLQKIEVCLEKSGVCGYTIQKDEDQLADLMFDSEKFIIETDIETPYTVGDFYYIRFVDNTRYGDSNEIVIEFKNGEKLYLYDFREYGALIYDGKYLHGYSEDDVITKYSQRISARKQGVDKNEFVIVNGVLSAYNGDSDIIIIPEGVNYIERGIFEGAEIMEVFFPNSLIAIGDFAFRSCFKLEKIHLNEGLTTIGDRAFCACEKLMDVELPTTLKVIKNAAFLKSGTKSFAKIPDECIVASDVFKI